jgi:hypothetical protein
MARIQFWHVSLQKFGRPLNDRLLYDAASLPVKRRWFRIREGERPAGSRRAHCREYPCRCHQTAPAEPCIWPRGGTRNQLGHKLHSAVRSRRTSAHKKSQLFTRRRKVGASAEHHLCRRRDKFGTRLGERGPTLQRNFRAAPLDREVRSGRSHAPVRRIRGLPRRPRGCHRPWH